MISDSPLTASTRKVVIALVFGALLPLLDASVINVAIRPLTSIFHTTVSLTQWVITGYALASTVAITLTGYLTQKFGATAIWKAAIIVFTVASILCALAWNIETLIGFRILQGAAAGLSMPVMQTILITSAGKEQATRAMTAVGLPAVIAPVLGPLLGGLLLQTFGWQSIFLINAPIGTIAFVLATRILRRAHPNDRRVRLDLTGFMLLAPGLILSVYALTTSENTGNGLLPFTLMAIAVILVGGYWFWAERTRVPLIDTVVFSYRTFVSAWLSLTLASIVFYGGLFLVPLFYQTVVGYSPLHSGLLLALLGVGAYISRSLANGLVIRLGTRATVYLFITCTIIGTLPFALPIPHTATWLFVDAAGLIVRGGGIGALTMVTMSALYHQMPAEYIVHASAFSRVATQLGSALGVAICTFLLALTGGVGATTFAYLTLITAFLGATSCALPRGRIRRL